MATEVNVSPSRAQQGDTATVLRSGVVAQTYVDRLPPNVRTASYTLALTDIAGAVEMAAGSANTLTIPSDASVAFAIGAVIMVYCIGTVTTVAADTGVTLNGVSQGGLTISGPAGAVTLIKRAANSWLALNRADVV